MTTRDDLLRDQLAHLPLGTRRPADAPQPVRVGISGSGQELLVLAWSARELARERAAGTRLLRRLGVLPGMRIANALPGALATPGSLLFGDVVEELGALDVPLGTVDGLSAATAAWELVDRVRPDVIVLGDAAEAFLAAAPGGARPWWRGIVWLQVGAASGRLGVPGAAGFAGWQRPWLAVPEATSFVAAGCDAGRFHVDERLLAEVVDATGVAGGGTLVVTALDLDVPPIRYATGLAARVVPGDCPCGQPAKAITLA